MFHRPLPPYDTPHKLKGVRSPKGLEGGSVNKPIYYAPVSHPRLGDELDCPRRHAIDVYRVAPHVWNVGGNDDVCCYLIDSGDGLVLLDTGYRASVYLLIDHIWQAGFDPRGIRKVLLSHWHWDHVNGASYIQGLSGCEIWLSAVDEKLHQKWKDDVSELPMAPYEITDTYEFSRPLEIGRLSIETRLVPGHTPGAVAFLFSDTDESTGRTYRCAMHGGLGVPMMRPEIRGKWDITEAMVRQFVSDCEELSRWHVDIMLPSHVNMGNVIPNIPEDRNDYRTWIAPYAWGDVLRDRKNVVLGYYPKEFFERGRAHER